MENIPQKQCNNCGEIKLISEFYHNKARKDGHSSKCKKCEDITKRNWAVANAEKVREYLRSWNKQNRAHARELNKRYKAEHPELVKKSAKKYSLNHAKQIAEIGKKWYKKNKERKKARDRKYRAEHPGFDTVHTRNRRALRIANGGVITKKEWQEVLDKYGHKCLRCQRTDVKLSMDHIIPLKLGGTHTKDNVQPLCIPCNSWKNARIIDFRPF